MWFKRYRYLIFVLALVAVFISWSYSSNGFIYSLVNSNVDSLVFMVQGYGTYGLLGYLLLVVLEVVIAPIPGLALYAAGGVLFGTLWGSLLAILGNMVGAAICFKIASTWGRKRFEQTVNRKMLDKFNKYVDKYGVLAMFVLRVNPLTSSDIFSYVAGFTRMKFWHFMLGTFLGLTPLVFVQAYFGHTFVSGNAFLYLLFLMLCVVYFIVFLWGIYALMRKR